MNPSEVAKLFAYACLFDGRLQADEGKILAWHSALYQEMTFEFAKYFVGVHYMNDDKVIQPSYFNKDWARKKRDEREKAATRSFMLELEDLRNKRATQEQVDSYVAQIRKSIGKAPNAQVETDSGTVAPNE